MTSTMRRGQFIGRQAFVVGAEKYGQHRADPGYARSGGHRDGQEFLLACSDDEPSELYRCGWPVSTAQVPPGLGPVDAMSAHPAANRRTVVLVGLMGAGKTCIGRRLARCLNLPFVDADDEIVKAAGASIPEIFRTLGESAFREGERRVIARLLQEPPQVMATGGGAFMDAATRALIGEHAVSIWLRAELDILVRRTSGRTSRPLLATGDPRPVLAALMTARYPIYARADVVVDTDDEPADATARRVFEALRAFCARGAEPATAAGGQA